MATFYSPWRSYGSGGQWRQRIDIDDPPSSVPASMSSVTLTARGRIQTQGTLFDSVNTNQISGDLGSASNPNVNVSHGSGGSTTLVVTRTGTVSTQYGQQVTVSVTFTVGAYEAFSGNGGSFTASVTIPARAFYTPNAATNLSVSRNSDTSQTISWSRNPTTARPIASQRVQRQANNGSWLTIATNLSGTATSYTDQTTAADSFYKYRIVTVNSSGTATSSATDFVYTTPERPSSVVATKTSAGNIALTITKASRAGSVEHQIQHSTNAGASWSTLTTTGATTYTHSSPNPANIHVYRVRTVIANSSAEAGNGLASAWRTSNSVQLEAPPNAPTNLQPNGITSDAATPLVLTWQHNPVDESPQRRFTVRHRWNTADAWTTSADIDSEESEWELPVGDTAGNLQVQVRTWGNFATEPAFSPWSATAVITRSNRPIVTITDPELGPAYQQSTLTVDWEYFDTDGHPQTQWRATLKSAAGQTIRQSTGSGTTSSHTFTTPLEDQTTYIIEVETRDTTGLWSEPDTVQFTTDFPIPARPNLAIEWDPQEGKTIATIEAQAPDTSSEEITRNLVPAPTDPEHPSWAPVFNGTPGAVSVDPTGGQDGTPAWQAIWEANNIGGVRIGRATTPDIEVEPATTYSISVYVDTTESVDILLSAHWYASDNTPLGDTPAPPVPFTPGEGQRIALENLTTPTGTHHASIHITVPDAMPEGGALRVSRPQLQPGPTATAPFDGDTRPSDYDATDVITTWETAANESPSILATRPEIDTDHTELWASIDGGNTWEPVALNLPTATTVTDPIPPLGVPVLYRAVAVSDLPSRRETIEQITTSPHLHWVWVNAGPGYGQSVRVRDNAEVSDTRGRAKVRKRYAGRQLPVEFAGEARERTLALTARLASDTSDTDANSSTAEQIFDLADLPAPAVVRRPGGTRQFVSTGTPTISAVGVTEELTWGMEEIDHER